MPVGFDGQLSPALLDAVIQQLRLWDRLVQVWNGVTEQNLQVPDTCPLSPNKRIVLSTTEKSCVFN